MVQHNMKKKVSLPQGVKTKKKGKKTAKQGPKKGHGLAIAPRKAAVVEQAKVSQWVSKTINRKNEKMISDRVDQAQGRTPAAAASSTSATDAQ